MVLAALVAALSGSTVAPPPTFDTFLDSQRRAPPRVLPRGVDRLFRAGQVTAWEERLGVPTFFRAPAPAPGEPSLRAQGLTPVEAARQHLLRWAPLYGLGGQTAASAPMTRLHDLGQGAIVATFEQRVDGVPVFRDRLHVVMNQRLDLVALSGYLSPVEKVTGSFRLAEPAAFSVALADVAGTTVAPGSLEVAGVDAAGMSLLRAAPGSALPLGKLARARKVLYGLPTGLVPAWYVELAVQGPGVEATMMSEVVAADDGRLLWKKDLVSRDSFSYRVFADAAPPHLPYDGPAGSDPSPLASGLPVPFAAPFVAPQLVTLANLPFSRNDPWLASGARVTSGNNVDAYADLVAPDGFNAGDQRATVTSPGVFDRVYDTTKVANVSLDQTKAGVTQVFYTINYLHDWYYDRGFAERDGNAQESNFGRGGAEGDPIHAEAQDATDFNNANMASGSDGFSPRMQMYVWMLEAPQVTALGKDLRTYGAAPGFGPAVYDLTAIGARTSLPDACDVLPESLTGKIAVIDRGNCTFAEKSSFAKAAGAVGVVIVDNVDPTSPIQMAGTGTIPILFVTQVEGDELKAALPTEIRMRGGGLSRDGDLDATVVAHEWAHYLSNRLVADGTGIRSVQARGLGEGWSDLSALLLVVRAGDDTRLSPNTNAGFSGVYALSTYASGVTTPDSAYYYGLRRYPYSTDLGKNPLTFKHIQDGVALPATPPPSDRGFTSSNNAEVHNTGEVWASMLWECYAELLTSGLPFAEAQDRMQRYFVASLKATPAEPTFVEARDALLAVAAATDPQDEVRFQRAFAKRGLGLHAVAPPSFSPDNSPAVEDFSTGSELLFVQATLDDTADGGASSCDHDGILDVGERGRLEVVLRNVGASALTAGTVTVTSTTAGVTITTATVPLSASTPYTLARATAEVTLAPGFTGDHVDLELTWTDPQLPTATAPRVASLSFRANLDAVATGSTTDDAETGLDVWTHVRDAALTTGYDWSLRDLGLRQRVFFGAEAPVPSDLSIVSPVLRVGNGQLELTLVHRWSVETQQGVNYDGTVIELSSNGGTTWQDLWFPDANFNGGHYNTVDGGYFGLDGGFAGIDGGYNGVLDAPSLNPLGGRPAFVDTSPGYPAFVTTVIPLGTGHAGQDLKLRFRIGTDDGTSFSGWEIDRISLTGITNAPFPHFVADRGQCVAQTVVANPGASFAADERTLVTLDGAASTGPAGQPLVGLWTQVSGPPVELASVDGGTLQVRFQAPEVRVDTALGFELQVRAGATLSAPGPLTVTVRNVNQPPLLAAAGPGTVDAGVPVTLTASAVDPEGQPVTFAWSQTSGPTVALSGASTPEVSFTTPAVTAQTDLGFQVVASDGQVTATATVKVTVAGPPPPPAPTGCGCQGAGAGGLASLVGLLGLAWSSRRRRSASPAPAR